MIYKYTVKLTEVWLHRHRHKNKNQTSNLWTDREHINKLT